MHRVAQLLAEAGVPPGVFQIVNGTVDTVNALIDHPDIAGITFVGSSRVAEIVHKRASALNKRVRACTAVISGCITDRRDKDQDYKKPDSTEPNPNATR